MNRLIEVFINLNKRNKIYGFSEQHFSLFPRQGTVPLQQFKQFRYSTSAFISPLSSIGIDNHFKSEAAEEDEEANAFNNYNSFEKSPY